MPATGSALAGRPTGQPCAWRQPVAHSASSCGFVSTPSAVRSAPSAAAMPYAACTMAWQGGAHSSWPASTRSSLRVAMVSWRRCPRFGKPPPKPSNATRRPAACACAMSAAAASTSRARRLVISMPIAGGATPAAPATSRRALSTSAPASCRAGTLIATNGKGLTPRACGHARVAQAYANAWRATGTIGEVSSAMRMNAPGTSGAKSGLLQRTRA